MISPEIQSNLQYPTLTQTTIASNLRLLIHSNQFYQCIFFVIICTCTYRDLRTFSLLLLHVNESKDSHFITYPFIYTQNTNPLQVFLQSNALNFILSSSIPQESGMPYVSVFYVCLSVCPPVFMITHGYHVNWSPSFGPASFGPHPSICPPFKCKFPMLT